MQKNYLSIKQKGPPSLVGGAVARKGFGDVSSPNVLKMRYSENNLSTRKATTT